MDVDAAVCLHSWALKRWQKGEGGAHKTASSAHQGKERGTSAPRCVRRKSARQEEEKRGVRAFPFAVNLDMQMGHSLLGATFVVSRVLGVQRISSFLIIARGLLLLLYSQFSGVLALYGVVVVGVGVYLVLRFVGLFWSFFGVLCIRLCPRVL